MATGKLIASIWTVTNNNDFGAGSLRQAIINTGKVNVFTFNLSSGNETIFISSESSITKSLTIDGSNDAGSGVVPVQATGFDEFLAKLSGEDLITLLKHKTAISHNTNK